MTKEELLLRKEKILKAIEAIENGAQEYDVGDLRIKFRGRKLVEFEPL